MKSRIFVLGLLGGLILSVLVGCGSSRQNNRMETAYALLNQDPDSALRILNSIDYHSFSEAERAYYALVYTIAQDKSGLDVSSDSLLQYAKAYYDEQSSDSLYAKYCYYYGKYHHLNNAYKQAENYLNNCIKKAEKDKDYYTLYLAWNRLSKSFNSINPESSILASKKAYHIYSEHYSDNVYNQIYLLLGIGDGYSLTANSDSTIYYYSKALHFADSIGNQELISASHQSLALVHQQTRQFSKSLFHAKKAWETAPSRSESLAYVLARAYMNADSLKQSLMLLDQLCLSKSDKMRMVAYQYKIYNNIRLHNQSYLEEIMDSFVSYSDKNYEKMLLERSSYYKDNLKLHEKGEQIEEQSLRRGITIWLLALLIVLGALSTLLVFHNIKLKHTQEEKLGLIQQKANEERMLLIQKNSEFQIKLLRKYILSNLHYLERLQELRNSNETHIDIGEETWMEIEMFLNVSQNQFAERLHNSFPNLSIDDLRFCMLLRLDFSLKDLARVYNLAVPSVKQKQNKFKQKLGLDDSNVSLRQYLLSF